MKKIFFFLYALVIGFILVGLYFRFVYKGEVPIIEIKIPFVGSQFSLENAPSKSLKGKIISMTGEIEWQSRVATESSKLTNSTTQIQQGESLKTLSTGNITVQFGDAAKIILLPKTKVDIIQTLTDDIVFNQTSGSATYEKTASYPVSVRILHLLVENGGSVTASIDELTGIITVSSDKGGATAAYNDQNNTSNIVKIPEGQKYVFNDDTRQGELE